MNEIMGQFMAYVIGLILILTVVVVLLGPMVWALETGQSSVIIIATGLWAVLSSIFVIACCNESS
jgi:uncharacterized protein YaaW (UPF0174 family)